MPRREPDTIRVETDEGQFDGFQSLEVINDIAGISEAVFSIGDADSAAELDELVKPGQPFKVYCNDRLRMSGRAEVNEVPCDASSGAVLQLTCRTKLSDARYARANGWKLTVDHRTARVSFPADRASDREDILYSV
jgi:hypothetical protein